MRMGNIQIAIQQQKYLDDMYEHIGIKHGVNITATSPVPAAALTAEASSLQSMEEEDQ